MSFLINAIDTFPSGGWFVSRTLVFVLSAMVLTGCGGYTGPSDYELYKQKQTGFEGVISSAGGTAKKEGKSLHGFTMTGWMINLSGGKVTDKLISQIVEVAQHDPVFELNLSKTAITDAQLAKLDIGKVLQKTVILDLSDTAITDAGLDKLSNFYCISSLNLKGSAATKAGAKRMGDKKIASPITPAPFKKQPEVKI